LKQLFCACFIIIFIIWAPACSKKQIKSVVDDISRDTYENNLRKQRIKHLKDPSYEEQPSYDQYQREIKEILNLATLGKRKMIIFKNPQNLSSSLKNFLYKEFKKKIDAFLVFEIEKDYNKFSEEIKEDLFLRFILKEGNLYRTYSSPTFSQIYKFIYAFRKNDYPQALKILENLFKEETNSNLLGTKLLGILIKNYSLFHLFNSSSSQNDLLSLLWETDRLIKEKGISSCLALERLLIKLYLRRYSFK